MLWNSNEIKLSIIQFDSHVIHAVAEVSCQSHPWILSAIYAPPNDADRSLFWDSLKSFNSNATLPWLLIGDFNDMLETSDKKGGLPIRAARINCFNNFVNACNLIDLGYNGPKFTWIRKVSSGNIIMERLDWAFGSQSWRHLFDKASVTHLPRISSDHCPILLDLLPTDSCPGYSPFKIQPMWFTHPEFTSFVDDHWSTESGPFHAIASSFAPKVLKWNKDVFGNIHHKLKHLLARIGGIQRRIQTNPAHHSLELEADLLNEYNQALLGEKLLWFTKSRVLWLQYGDASTRFFHTSTVIRRHKNCIRMLCDDSGAWITDATAISALITSHFKVAFTTESLNTPLVPTFTHLFPTFSEASHLSLVANPITENEIWGAFKSFKPYKSPGPDGLHPIFFQNCWSSLQDSVVNTIQQAFLNPRSISDLNETFLCLIPKVERPEYVKQFRPISLCNTIYKCITKILVNRIRPYLNTIINPLQTSFLPGRKGSDNIILVQEALHSLNLKKGRTGYMCIKLDLDKAFDRLDWGCIHHCLNLFGFPKCLSNLILHCITSPKMSVIVNGKVGTQFEPTRGVRQGDCISPYIFILVLELLHIQISNAIDSKNWTPLSFGRTGHSISHCFFADDIILFGRADMETATSISNILNTFCEWTGQKISYDKSKVLFSKNCKDELKVDISCKLQIKETKSLGKYLGFPLKVGKLPLKEFNFIVEKVQNKLKGWRANSLSLAGRMTLIKATSSAISNHYCQFSFLPKGVCEKIDKVNRKFLWGADETHKKLHHVNWNQVTRPKNQGGLGIRKTSVYNKVTMAKLNWRVLKEPNTKWCAIMRSKYFSGFAPNHSRPKLNQSASINARNLDQGWKLFSNGLVSTIGDGSSTHLFHDNWTGQGRLREIIHGPLLPSDYNALVSSIICPSTKHWDFSKISFPIPSSLAKIILAIPLSIYSSTTDNLGWSPSSNGSFSTQSAYELEILDKHNVFPNLEWIWKLNVLPKIKTFLWLVCLDKLPTRMSLFKKHITNDPLCNSCFAEETCRHILWECPRTLLFWRELGFIPTALHHSSSVSLWIKTNAANSSPVKNVYAGIVFLFGCWCLWYNRNIRLFDGLKPPQSASDCLHRATEFVHLGLNSSLKKGKIPKLITWKPPPTGVFTLNTDGAAKGNPGPAGCGGLIRDHFGNWVAGYARKIPWGTNTLAELWALRDGLDLAKKLSISPIIIECDAEVVISLVNNLNIIDKHFNVLVDDCRWLLSKIANLGMHHVFREANRSADALANLGCTLNHDFCVFRNPPPGVAMFVDLDRGGVGSTRICTINNS